MLNYNIITCHNLDFYLAKDDSKCPLHNIEMIHNLKLMEGGSKTKSRLECRHWDLGAETKKGNQL